MRSALIDYFRKKLLVRNKGLLAVFEYQRSICVSLGQHQPFMVVTVDNPIVLELCYPTQLASCADCRVITTFSGSVRERSREILNLTRGLIMIYARLYPERMEFPLEEPKSLHKAEFCIQVTITRVRSFVRNNGEMRKGFASIPEKDRVPLLELARKDYEEKVVSKWSSKERV